MSARVLVIGLDSVDEAIVLRMSAAGRLPTLARLLAEGAHAETINPIGFYVGALWSSFSTATSPARHGRHSPRQLVPGTYDARPLTPHEIRRPPFWLALADAGKRSAIVDVPHSRCLERAGGWQVVEWGSHDPALDFGTWPADLADTIVTRFGRHPIHPDVAHDCDVRRTTPADWAAFRAALLEGVARKADLNAFVLGANAWDLMVTVFCEGHCANHHAWHLHDPSHPRHDAAVAAAVGDVLEAVYEALDAAVARLLADAGDDTTVFVLASHGAGPHYDGSYLLDRVLRRLERARLPAHRRLARDAFAWAWDRLPVHRQMHHPRFRDRLWRGYEALPPLNPATRRWFKIDNNEPYGAVRINLAGREPHGIVAPTELDACIADLRRELLALVHVETGRPAVRQVLRTADLYRGENLDMLPDLLVEWERSVPVRGVASPTIGTLTATYADVRTGDHRDPGLLMARGPDIAPGRLAPVPLVDLAPTIAARLGVTLPDVDGTPVAALAGRPA